MVNSTLVYSVKSETGQQSLGGDSYLPPLHGSAERRDNAMSTYMGLQDTFQQ